MAVYAVYGEYGRRREESESRSRAVGRGDAALILLALGIGVVLEGEGERGGRGGAQMMFITSENCSAPPPPHDTHTDTSREKRDAGGPGTVTGSRGARWSADTLARRGRKCRRETDVQMADGRVLRCMHACSTVTGGNRACISQCSLASLPRSPDFARAGSPPEERVARSCRAVREARLSRRTHVLLPSRQRLPRPWRSCDASCSAASGQAAGRMHCCRCAGACYDPGVSYDASCGTDSNRAAGRMPCCSRADAASERAAGSCAAAVAPALPLTEPQDACAAGRGSSLEEISNADARALSAESYEGNIAAGCDMTL
jgi:hypothetical protein